MPAITPHYRHADGRGSQQYMVSQQKEEIWSPDRGYEEPAAGGAVPSQPKRARAKDSSKHFGVRFRPDLQKWVAEIRVAEWRSVDKKVWLGTFDSEEGAARAVDAARKLLKCKKKRPPNFPCEHLRAYSERIPPSLNLTNLGDDGMFKQVTAFVKRKAQEYAASFGSKPALGGTASLSAQLFSHPSTSEVAVLECEVAVLECEVAVLECEVALDGAPTWMSPVSLPLSGPGSVSTSPGSEGWFYDENLSFGSLSTSSFSEFDEEFYVEPMDIEFIAEFLEGGDEQVPQFDDDSLILHPNEIFSGMENHNVWMQQSFNNTYTLSNSLDYNMVC